MKTCNEVARAIKALKIRGAPLLGAAAAYGIALTAYHSRSHGRDKILQELEASAQLLRGTRPTAVNLFWAVKRVIEAAKGAEGDAKAILQAVTEEAHKIAREDIEANRKIGAHGSKVVGEEATILTHCNAGSLATVDFGTALGVIRAAWKDRKNVKVIATETRPLLQGARLTSYELHREGIPVTLITDSMVGSILSRGLVDLVIVGADRIMKDAVINKIGTYTIAVLAKENSVPFYIAAPKSTFDTNRMAKEVKIEERSMKEVTDFRGVQVAPHGVPAFNPAFDITPLKYVIAIICEEGVIHSKDFHRLSDF